MRFEFIQEHTGGYSIKRMCALLRISRSGYYAWKTRRSSTRAQENDRLLEHIRRIYIKNRRVYGSPRIYAALRTEGIPCGVHRVARIMKKNGIQAVPHCRMKNKSLFTSTIDVGNLLQRQFMVKVPNTVWVTDITSFWTSLGWLNVAVIMDLYSRRIIGWAMGNRMTEELTIAAVEMAVLNRNPEQSLILHSDQGGQYQGAAYHGRLRLNNIIPSMSRRGDCYDNAVIESFFKTLKSELGIDNGFKTREEARSKIFEYIEIFYNRQRLHSTLGYVSPEQFEMKHNPKQSVH